MSQPSSATPEPPEVDDLARGVDRPERRTAPVELLWDLVFVFAVTQVTALVAHHPSWARLGDGMLLVAVALMALYVLGGSIPAWTVAAGIAALVGALCLAESLAEEPELVARGPRTRRGPRTEGPLED